MNNPIPRSKVKKNQTWNAESVFDSPDAFEAETKNILKSLSAFKKYQGHLGDDPDTFIKAMKAMDKLSRRTAKVRVYATMSNSVDTTDQSGIAMNEQAMNLIAQINAAQSFIEPELLSIGEPKLRKWLKDDPRMELYEHFFNDLFRKQAHVRDAEVEELLGMLRDPFSSTQNTASMLANADFKFKPAKDSKGKKVQVTQSTLIAILRKPDRKARKTAWENYQDKYLEYKNTLASNLVQPFIKMFRVMV